MLLDQLLGLPRQAFFLEKIISNDPTTRTLPGQTLLKDPKEEGFPPPLVWKRLQPTVGGVQKKKDPSKEPQAPVFHNFDIFFNIVGSGQHSFRCNSKNHKIFFVIWARSCHLHPNLDLLARNAPFPRRSAPTPPPAEASRLNTCLTLKQTCHQLGRGACFLQMPKDQRAMGGKKIGQKKRTLFLTNHHQFWSAPLWSQVGEANPMVPLKGSAQMPFKRKKTCFSGHPRLIGQDMSAPGSDLSAHGHPLRLYSGGNPRVKWADPKLTMGSAQSMTSPRKKGKRTKFAYLFQILGLQAPLGSRVPCNQIQIPLFLNCQ